MAAPRMAAPRYAIRSFWRSHAVSTVKRSGHLRGGIRYLCSLLLEGGDMDGTQETSPISLLLALVPGDIRLVLLEGGDMDGTQETSTKPSSIYPFWCWWN